MKKLNPLDPRAMAEALSRGEVPEVILGDRNKMDMLKSMGRDHRATAMGPKCPAGRRHLREESLRAAEYLDTDAAKAEAKAYGLFDPFVNVGEPPTDD